MCPDPWHAYIVLSYSRGNPFFALEFIRSLIDSRLVKYSLREKRWIWDEARARSDNITDNVLYLLSTKMATLPENIQLVLKVVSCIGIKIHQNVIDLLKKSPKYAKIDDWFVQAINEGFIRKLDNSEFKLVHDKVREAAYSLIKDDDKNQVRFLVSNLYAFPLECDYVSYSTFFHNETVPLWSGYVNVYFLLNRSGWFEWCDLSDCWSNKFRRIIDTAWRQSRIGQALL